MKKQLKFPFGTMSITPEARQLVNEVLDTKRVSQGKLVREFEKQNWLKMRLKYDDVKDIRFKSKRQTYRRDGCKPKTYFKYKGKQIIRYPDIVIYSDIADPDNPPDKTKDINFHMLLAIEIKYQTEWSGDWNPYNKKMDIAKMKRLIKQADDKTIYGSKHAWCLNFYRPETELPGLQSKGKVKIENISATAAGENSNF